MTDLDVRPEHPEPIEPRKTSLLHRLYHGEIPAADRGHHQVADARPSEHGFDDQCAVHQLRHQHSGDGDDR